LEWAGQIRHPHLYPRRVQSRAHPFLLFVDCDAFSEPYLIGNSTPPQVHYDYRCQAWTHMWCCSIFDNICTSIACSAEGAIILHLLAPVKAEYHVVFSHDVVGKSYTQSSEMCSRWHHFGQTLLVNIVGMSNPWTWPVHYN
jgi:hypothetical protein